MSDTAHKETLSFQTEVKQLLDLMINSLYSNKEIFLRELISNASDANDKIRYLALNNKSLPVTDLGIKVDIDEAAKTIKVSDTGIGMNREDIIQNLGTIAKSGTKEFFQKLTGDSKKDSKLIGQFGVGFYSGFIVADKITVRSLKAGDSAENAVQWESTGTGEYTIDHTDKTTNGTEVILHLKEDAAEFLNSHRLKHIIRQYSDHINFPIKMLEEKAEEAPEDSTQDSDATKESSKDVTPPQYEVVNKATALWTLPKSEIKAEEYNEFYKYISHDFEDPLSHSHNKVEGKQEYTTLLYLPKRAPFDLFQSSDKPRGIKLYVQRTYIMDDAEILPRYLRFVRGIIDSNDLPLNISREILQTNKLVESIKASVTKRVLSMLENLAKNDKQKYADFWKEFGQVIKEGPAEDFANRERIGDLLRFASTRDDSESQSTSLQEYVDRMPSTQQHIYYIAADSYQAALNSPHLETFKKNKVEVILLYDRIDEWLMSHFTEYKGKSFKSVTRGDLDLNDLNEDKASLEKAQKEAENVFKDTLGKVKSALAERVEDVRVTQRLTDSPACIVAQENAMTSQMERLLKAAGQAVPVTKPILELNPDHPLVVRLKNAADGSHFNELSEVLLDQAILAEGGQLEDPATFVKRFNRLLLGE